MSAPSPPPGPSPGALARELAARHEALRGDLPRLAGLFEAAGGGLSGAAARDLRGAREAFDELRLVILSQLDGASGAEVGVSTGPAAPRRRLLQALERMRSITRGFAPPEDATPAHRELFCGLSSLEHELTLCAHLEDGIRFLRACPPDR